MSLRKYLVLTPLLNNGELVDAGETVQLEEKQGEELLACGALAVIDKTKTTERGSEKV